VGRAPARLSSPAAAALLFVVLGAYLLVVVLAISDEPGWKLPLFLFYLAGAGLTILYSAIGGPRFRREGFRLCPGCGWVRRGEAVGAAVAGARDRALRCVHGTLVALALPGIYYFGMFVYRTVEREPGHLSSFAWFLGFAGLAVWWLALARAFLPVPDHSPR
jgi:hypothetical protein